MSALCLCSEMRQKGGFKVCFCLVYILYSSSISLTAVVVICYYCKKPLKEVILVSFLTDGWGQRVNQLPGWQL